MAQVIALNREPPVTAKQSTHAVYLGFADPC